MHKNSNFFIGGKHTVNELIKFRPSLINYLICTKARYPEVNRMINHNNLKIKIIISDNSKIDDLFEKNFNHQDIACNIKKQLFKNANEFKNNTNEIVIFEELYDLRNLGSIVRTGLAFEIKHFFFNKKNTKSNSEKIYKSSSGYIPLINAYEYTNLSTLIKNLKKQNYWFVGLDSSAKNELNNFDWPKKTAVIVGNESFGLKQLTKKNCDFLIKIKLNDQVESLNVSNAFAITIAKKKRP